MVHEIFHGASKGFMKQFMKRSTGCFMFFMNAHDYVHERP